MRHGAPRGRRPLDRARAVHVGAATPPRRRPLLHRHRLSRVVHFPDDELSTYTAAAVVLAADALVGATPASRLFTEHQPLPSIVLADDDLDLEDSRD